LQEAQTIDNLNLYNYYFNNGHKKEKEIFFAQKNSRYSQKRYFDKMDKELLTLSTILIAIDWGQTLDIVNNSEEYYETNPFLGDHPSRGKVNTYFAGWVIANYGVTKLLKGNFRKAWLWSLNAFQLSSIHNNYNIGLRLNF
jgi:hypothetical protein